MVASINASTSAGVVTTADTSGSLALQTAGTTALTLDTSQNATFAGSVKTNTLTSAASTALTLQSAGTTAVTVDTSQNVGIGTASPTNRLDIQAAKAKVFATSTTGTNDCYFAANNTGGAFQIGLDNSAGTEFGTAYAGVLYRSGAYPINFYTNANERMRIDSSGKLLVGKTTSGAGTVGLEYEGSGGALLITRASNPTILCNRQGSSGTNIQFRFQDADCGSISVNTGSTAYNTSSDYRLKENIAPLTSGLDKVAQLKPVTYKWKSDGSYGEGFIAHELAEVCPLAVHGSKDAVDADGNPVYQGIDTSFLVATLTAAIQELKAINDQQAEELSRQAATINAQSEAIASLTARVVALEGQ